MKRFMVGLIVGLSLMFSVQVFAEDGLTKIEAYLRPDLPIQLDGQRISLESSPVMVDGNTYLKLRDIAKLTGLGVTWNQDTQTVELSTYGNITSPVDSATSTTSTPITAPSSTTSVVPSSSVSGTVGANKSTGGSTMIFTNVELEPVSKDGVDYYSLRNIAAKYYNTGYGYDFNYDGSKDEINFIRYTASGHPYNQFEVLFPAIPKTSMTVINGETYISVDEYTNVILPLIQ